MTRGAGQLRLVSSAEQPASASRPHDELSDIAAAVVKGDQRALRTFLVTVVPALVKVVRRVLGAHHPDVEDVVQESATNVLDSLPRFREESKVIHFACRIALRTALNSRRRALAMKRAVTTDPSADLELLPSTLRQPDQDLSARRSAAAVRRLLDELPIEQAEVLALHCVLGYTLPEVAHATKVPLETARSRLRLAKQQLRHRVRSDARWAELAEVRLDD